MVDILQDDPPVILVIKRGTQQKQQNIGAHQWNNFVNNNTLTQPKDFTWSTVQEESSTMEIPTDTDESDSAADENPWYLYDGGWDRIDVLGIRREWARHNTEPPGWLQWQKEDVPLDARRQYVPGQERHGALMQDMLDEWCELRAWRLQGRNLPGPDPLSRRIVDQKGGWARMDRLGISHEYVRNHRFPPRGWLLWQQEDVPMEMRAGNWGQQSAGMNTGRAVDRDSQRRVEGKPMVRGHKKHLAKGRRKTGVEEGKKGGGEAPAIQHARNERRQRRTMQQQKRLLHDVEVARRNDEERELNYLAQRGVHLNHARMPSSIYSNTESETSDLSGSTLPKMEVEEQKNERLVRLELARQREVMAREDTRLEEMGDYLLRSGLMPNEVAVRPARPTSELSFNGGDDSSDDWDCNKKTRAKGKNKGNKKW
jgi:hypothetical protein